MTFKYGWSLDYGTDEQWPGIYRVKIYKDTLTLRFFDFYADAKGFIITNAELQGGSNEGVYLGSDERGSREEQAGVPESSS